MDNNITSGEDDRILEGFSFLLEGQGFTFLATPFFVGVIACVDSYAAVSSARRHIPRGWFPVMIFTCAILR